MDDDALQARLRAVERRQYLLIALLVPPNYLAAADLFGYWIAGVALFVLACLSFSFVLIRGRQRRESAGV
ncbi:hypothetical protein [Halosimplex pelagicum]|uniref:Uncharacterized protein n=1 Tax=Halosimplex pelagicum TaxID=869886 RepID=A0A7D5T9V2_9EURY|nr:hypothetical protein [Halosimplex pelagicum]QLH80829.1 hypothetical protein HZS54_03875 [Halosimplex pelagicum]